MDPDVVFLVEALPQEGAGLKEKRGCVLGVPPPVRMSAGVARFPGELYGEAVETVHRPDAGERGRIGNAGRVGGDHVSERFEKASGEELLLSGEAAYQSLVHEGLPPLPVDILLGRNSAESHICKDRGSGLGEDPRGPVQDGHLHVVAAGVDVAAWRAAIHVGCAVHAADDLRSGRAHGSAGIGKAVHIGDEEDTPALPRRAASRGLCQESGHPVEFGYGKPDFPERIGQLLMGPALEISGFCCRPQPPTKGDNLSFRFGGYFTETVDIVSICHSSTITAPCPIVKEG
jgi:hypothetical protein